RPKCWLSCRTIELVPHPGPCSLKHDPPGPRSNRLSDHHFAASPWLKEVPQADKRRISLIPVIRLAFLRNAGRLRFFAGMIFLYGSCSASLIPPAPATLLVGLPIGHLET